MGLALHDDGLLTVWSFAGANTITSDIYSAEETHDVESGFIDWIFHVRLQCYDKVREYFELAHFRYGQANPSLTGKLRGALNIILRLRCVNQDLRTQCSSALHKKGVVLHELFCACQPVRKINIVGLEGVWYDIHGFCRHLLKTLKEQSKNPDDDVLSLESKLDELRSKELLLRKKNAILRESNQNA